MFRYGSKTTETNCFETNQDKRKQTGKALHFLTKYQNKLSIKLFWLLFCLFRFNWNTESLCFGKWNNRKKHFVSDSAKTSFGSSFEWKLVSKNTLAIIDSLIYIWRRALPPWPPRKGQFGQIALTSQAKGRLFQHYIPLMLSYHVAGKGLVSQEWFLTFLLFRRYSNTNFQWRFKWKFHNYQCLSVFLGVLLLAADVP